MELVSSSTWCTVHKEDYIDIFVNHMYVTFNCDPKFFIVFIY
jgi:hypothetical protein